jgi:hypothetical protein
VGIRSEVIEQEVAEGAETLKWAVVDRDTNFARQFRRAFSGLEQHFTPPVGSADRFSLICNPRGAKFHPPC